MKSKLLLILLCLVSLMLFACETNSTDPNSNPKPVDPVSKSITQEYVLSQATLDGVDVSATFSFYNVCFNEDLTMEVQIFHNYLEMRNATYTYFGSIITENYGEQTYQYTVVGENLFTIYDDLGDQIEITLKPKVEDEMNKEVAFESVLFGESLMATKKYNYCPAIIEEEVDGKTIMHIWYCMNRDSGVIMDYIGYRKGVLQESGNWIFSDEEIAIAPTPNTWDARHTCDPSVIKGIFNYHGTEYHYLMAYLGCTTEDYQKNETGFALSVEANGPWVKIDEINPIVPWYDDGNIEAEEAKYQSYKGTSQIYWGTGMPSLVSIDGEGRFLFFYQSTLRGTGIKEVDLSDAANPVVKYTASLTSNNIVNSQGQKCRISIPDFAYDSEAKRFYVASVTNERNPADVTLTRVNSHSFVAYLENIESMEVLAELLNGGNYSWHMLGYVGPSDTGWERNHNPGLVKDNYGYVPDSSKIQVVVSTGHNSWGNENIFTYRLYGHTFLVE